MPLEFRCRRCGRAYIPDHAAIVAGPQIYRLCENCRPVDATPPRPIPPAVASIPGDRSPSAPDRRAA